MPAEFPRIEYAGNWVAENYGCRKLGKERQVKRGTYPLTALLFAVMVTVVGWARPETLSPIQSPAYLSAGVLYTPALFMPSFPQFPRSPYTRLSGNSLECSGACVFVTPKAAN